jgi:predicted nuclease with RNAse H fold
VYAGIDLGADRIQCVAIDEDLRVVGTWLFTAREVNDLVTTVHGAARVAVDAPAETSSLPHVNDAALSPRFQRGRCAEIALGRQYGYWVPFVAPAQRPTGDWMATGFSVYDALAKAAIQAIEVFPWAGFRALAPLDPLPKKTSIEGLRERIRRLDDVGVRAHELAAWSHDGLDALLGALIARDAAIGTGRRVTCGHDGSAIWLPTKA